jgi:RNA polymerase sigma-70 factor (ECF subfamily)
MTLPRAYEDQLVERAKGDADAFGELYDHYFGQIYRFVYSRLRDQDAAEDVTSEVFFKALRAIHRYRPSGHPFSAWLYQISVNAIADHYRAKRPESDLDAAVAVATREAPLDERVAQRDEAARVWAAIDSLPPQQRTAMTLKLGEDLKLAQIGAIMGKSEGAVKLLIHRGMIGVRQRLGIEAGRETPHANTAPSSRETP